MLVHQIPDLAALNAPPGAALHFDGRRWSFAQLADDCHRLARGLAGLAPAGARVAVLSRNRPEFLACYFAIPGAGQVMVPLNIRLSPRELALILQDSEPALLLVEAELLPLLAELRAQQPQAWPADRPTLVLGGADDASAGLLGYDAWLASAGEAGPALSAPRAVDHDAPAWLLYTSGTTGRPKGALLSHRNLLAGIVNTLVGFDLPRQPTVALYLFPQFHIAGYVLPAYLLRGDSIVLMRGFDVGEYLALVQQHRVAMHSIAPTMLAMLLDDERMHQFDTSSLRHMLYGASAMPPELLRRAMARWPAVRFGTAFGMTELCGNVSFFDGDEHRHALAQDHSLLTSCGRVMPLAAVRIVDDAGQAVADGTPGEIAIRGDQVFSGYWRNPVATAESMRDGWFFSGDIGRRDAQGRFFVVDRKKDMVISGGENVYSREVEDLLHEHPAVAEAAVLGEPDPVWGERVVALLRLRPGMAASAADIASFCKPRIAGYKRPRRILFSAEPLPKTPAGKVKKAELRQRLHAGDFNPQAAQQDR